MDNLKYIIESLLFISSTPLSMERLRQSIPEADAKMIRAALETLGREYELRGGGFALHHVAGGYQLRTRPEYAQWIKRLHQSQPVRLSKPALETLAIIAYRQPVLRSDIEYIRGVDSGGVLKMLLEKQLIRVLGRDTDKPGRPMIYSTTKKFLEVFDLKDLSELPTLKELEELGLSKKQKDEDDYDPDDLSPALPDAAGFAEFRNRRNLTPLEPPNLGAGEPVEFAEPDQEDQEQGDKGEGEEGPQDYAVDEDRYPEGMDFSGDSNQEYDEESGPHESDAADEREDWEQDEETWDEPPLSPDEEDDFSSEPGDEDPMDDFSEDDYKDRDFEEDFDDSEEDYSGEEDSLDEDDLPEDDKD
ncbi:segregation and condensation protein B [Desulfatibacillum alkenivorans DSM 16219]|jgi:segregation and condensation protein B|uniref:Segregation and condensation protein B n=1 Tax=Desulfatibacillum alkenivorans DSM 16219 TaxID=1121393 RepID=A0A1M6C4G3_9BACT|nr:SMC-Scp complex subunit ScpB [Desulfatibacillum alkenivorans]SHI55598.1 segregation and condensation protein B [Desulfatibacillum alkenivorans DSM 16219]